MTVDARDKNNRAKQFKVVTTILDASIDGQQIGNLYERRWDGEVDIRTIKCTMQMDTLSFTRYVSTVLQEQRSKDDRRD